MANIVGKVVNSKAQTGATQFGEVGASDRICYILWEQCSKRISWQGFWDINVLALAQSLQCKVTRNEGFCDFWLPSDFRTEVIATELPNQ